jgi:photosystem II stability/assembly factor-like uncharacterized protein
LAGFRPEAAGNEAPSSAASLSDTALGWIVGTPTDGYGTIIHTRDGGQNWVRQGSSGEIPNVLLNGVWAIDTQNVWAVGESDSGYGTILRTVDGGQHWTRQGSLAQIPDVGLSSVSAVNGSTAWAVGTDGTILHTHDGGQNWTQQTGGTIPNVELQGVYAVDAQTAWVSGPIANSYGTMLRTVDGGVTWQRPGYTQLPENRYLISVFALNADTVWAVGNGRIVVHTTDAGKTWDNVSPIQPPDFYDGNGITVLHGTILWFVTDNGGIFRSDDGGANWTPQPSGGGGYHLLRISALDTDNAWVTGAANAGGAQLGIILHTEDGGDSWSQQTAPANAEWWGVSFLDGRPHIYLPLITIDWALE